MPVPALGASREEGMGRRRPVEVARALLVLTKPRIVELLLVTTVPTMLLAARGVPSATLVVATLAGGAMAAGGANALNMVVDRDIDAQMTRTRKRPLVTGALSVRTAALFAIGLEAGALVLLWEEANPLAAGLALGAAAFYVLVYTMWLKRSTPQNIVIGGAAGAVPTLVAWAAVRGTLPEAAWVLFAVVVLWTPPHFWALAIRYRDDYATAGIPMLPVVADVRKVADQIVAYSLLVVAASLVLAPAAHLAWEYVPVTGLLGAVFVGRAWMLRRHPTAERAMRLFQYSILYLALLFAAVAVFAVVPR